jgi:hypothetical protein
LQEAITARVSTLRSLERIYGIFFSRLLKPWGTCKNMNDITVFTNKYFEIIHLLL